VYRIFNRYRKAGNYPCSHDYLSIGCEENSFSGLGTREMECIEEPESGILELDRPVNYRFIKVNIFCNDLEFLLNVLSPIIIGNPGNFQIDHIASDKSPVFPAPFQDSEDSLSLDLNLPVPLIIERPAQAADIHVDFHLEFPGFSGKCSKKTKGSCG
jgi:hypothetical protein